MLEQAFECLLVGSGIGIDAYPKHDQAVETACSLLGCQVYLKAHAYFNSPVEIDHPAHRIAHSEVAVSDLELAFGGSRWIGSHIKRSKHRRADRDQLGAGSRPALVIEIVSQQDEAVGKQRGTRGLGPGGELGIQRV